MANEIINKKHLYRPYRPLGEKWLSLTTYAKYKENFNLNPFPNEEKLKKIETASIRNYTYDTNNKIINRINNFVEELKKDNRKLITDFEKNVVDQAVKNLEKLSFSKKNINHLIKNSEIKINGNNIKPILNNIKTAWETYLRENKEILPQELKQVINELDANLKLLQDKLDKLDEINISEIQSWTTNKMSKYKPGEQVNFIRSMGGIISALKGYELEKAAVEWLTNHIPTEENILILQTGSIKKLGKDIKEDIGIFPNLENIEIKMANGKTKALKDFKDEKTTISINDEGYQQLIENMITGFSVKSSKTTHIIQTVSLQQVINLTVDDKKDTKHLHWVLYHLKQLIDANKGFSPVDETKEYEYTTLYNYAVAHSAQKLLGKKNLYFITPQGIISTQQEIETLLKNNSKLPLRIATQTVNLKSTETQVALFTAHEKI